MRENLAHILVQKAKQNSKFLVLSGDHGYALFDPIRKECPKQFINVGVSEQGMIGYAAGLAKVGYQVVVYGLAAFVPMRVLEQIRLDICFNNHNVIILGDGAGLVYSYLGTSHQCTEDLSAIRVLPNINVYSPCDKFELESCLNEAFRTGGPNYVRLGKADRPEVYNNNLVNTDPNCTSVNKDSEILLIGTGSFSIIAKNLANKFNVTSISIPKIHPMNNSVIDLIKGRKLIICLEEHNQTGGLYSCILELLSGHDMLTNKTIKSISIPNKFNHFCGSHQYALSEHNLNDEQVELRISQILKEYL